MRLSLIGGFELAFDGKPARVPPSSQRLVAYLALRDRPLERVHIAGSLWTDCCEERALANLRSALWRLGAQAAVVEATGTHVCLSSRATVDLREVSELARGLLEHPDANAPWVENSRLSGDLLPDWYDDWVLLERERLRQLCVHALEHVAVQATARGRFSHAIDTALRAIEADPLRETAHRVLIDAYLAEGNAGAAVRQFDAFARQIGAELGLEPSPQLRAMFAHLH